MSRQPKNPALLNATQGDVVALINLIMSPIVRDLKARIDTLEAERDARPSRELLASLSTEGIIEYVRTGTVGDSAMVGGV